jgi:hypothetical protein
MSVTTTTHYGLKKPDGSEAIKPDPFNDNADAIDSLLYDKVYSGSATLSTSGWVASGSLYKYTLAVTGLLATDSPVFDRVTGTGSSAAALINTAWALVTGSGINPQISAGQVVLYATAVPATNVQITWKGCR